MKYLKYFLYILEHKKNVFKCCWKRGLFLHTFTHDLSKFLPDEFFPYANWFYDKKLKQLKAKEISIKDRLKHKKIRKAKKTFEKACQKHYDRNKHHWQCCCVNDKNTGKRVVCSMSTKYIIQMVCDWEGVSLKFGGAAKDYYQKNKDKILLQSDSRKRLEKLLEN